MHEHSNDVTITATLPADDLPAIAHAALNLPASDMQAVDQQESERSVGVDAVSAPVGFEPTLEPS